MGNKMFPASSALHLDAKKKKNGLLTNCYDIDAY